MRYIADRFDAAPLGFELDVELCAMTIGLGSPKGANAAFPRMLNRCRQFKLLRVVGPTTVEIRRMLPPLNYKQVLKLPPRLQVEHKRWLDATPSAAEVADLGDRARRLALSLLQLGEEPSEAERQLRRWRFHPAMAREAITWAQQRHDGKAEETANRTTKELLAAKPDLAADSALSGPDPQQEQPSQQEPGAQQEQGAP